MITDRIEEILTVYNLSASEFADKIQVPRSSMSHITSGRNKPSLDFVMKIKHAFPEVNTDWLIFGKGKKIQKEGILTEQVTTKQQDPTPTLFSNVKHDSEGNENDSNLTKKQKIQKIVIFYQDGTFQSFDEKS